MVFHILFSDSICNLHWKIDFLFFIYGAGNLISLSLLPHVSLTTVVVDSGSKFTPLVLMRAANSCRCCRPRQKIPAVVVVAGTKLAPLFLTLAENSHRCCWRRQQIHAVVVDTSWHLQQICCWCCWHRHKLSNCTVPRGANIFVSFRKNLK